MQFIIYPAFKKNAFIFTKARFNHFPYCVFFLDISQACIFSLLHGIYIHRILAVRFINSAVLKTVGQPFLSHDSKWNVSGIKVVRAKIT